MSARVMTFDERRQEKLNWVKNRLEDEYGKIEKSQDRTPLDT